MSPAGSIFFTYKKSVPFVIPTIGGIALETQTCIVRITNGIFPIVEMTNCLKKLHKRFMTILEKTILQNQNPTKVYLFKEGIFYKVYNEGAFLMKDKNYKEAEKRNTFKTSIKDFHF